MLIFITKIPVNLTAKKTLETSSFQLQPGFLLQAIFTHTLWMCARQSESTE